MVWSRIVATLFVVQTLLFVGVTWVIAKYASRWIGGLQFDGARHGGRGRAIVVLLGIALLPVHRLAAGRGGDAVNVVRLFE